MNKSLWKLLDFLKEMFINTMPLCKEEFFSSTKDETEHSEATSVAGLLAMWLEDDATLSKYNIISDDLNFLIIVLDSIKNNPEKFQNESFKNKEITNIIFHFLKKNLENGILDESKELRGLSNYIMDQPFNHMGEVADIAYQKDYYQSFKRMYTIKLEGKTPNPNSVYILNVFEKRKIKELRQTYKTIKEHYFDKIETYTAEDVEKVLKAMKIWPKVECVEDIIRETLLFRINKRKEPQKEVEIKRVERVSKPILTKKEYHEIKDELDSKFDFERMEPRINVTLTPEEIEHCINLMNQLSFTDREKEIFLEKSFKKTREELLNIDSIMILLKSQIEFYNINTETVNKAMENLELYIEEYKNVEDIIEKEEWYELIKEEVQIINVFIPRTFEYEKKLLLQK